MTYSEDRAPHVLVADDEWHIAKGIEHTLTRHDYDVTVVNNGEDALDRIRGNYTLDLAILDIVMPRLSGLEVLDYMKHFGSKLPVIIVSAKTQTSDRVRGLKAGADDYLIKPFSTQELMARVKAVMRRSDDINPLPKQIRVGDVRIDFEKAKAHRNGVSVNFTPIEWRMLKYMAFRRGAAISRPEFNMNVLEIPRDIKTRTVDRHAFAIRSKLDKNPRRPQHILSVHGVGYRLSDFEWVA